MEALEDLVNRTPSSFQPPFADRPNAIVRQARPMVANSRGDHCWQVCPYFFCGHYRQLTVTLLSPLPQEMCKLGSAFPSCFDFYNLPALIMGFNKRCVYIKVKLGSFCSRHWMRCGRSLWRDGIAAEGGSRWNKKWQVKIGQMWMEWKNCMKWLPPKQCESTRPMQGSN